MTSLSRRDALRLAGTIGLAAPLAGCVDGYASAPDPLAPVADAAEADGDAARALAAAEGSTAEVAGAIATIRLEQADVVRQEVERENRPESEEADRDPRVADLASLGERLMHAESQARDLLVEVTGYRAGLLGAVAAGCAGARVLDSELGETASSGSGDPTLDTDEVDDAAVGAMQVSLAAEHAAVWSYELVSAFLDGPREDVADAADVHRVRRDTTARAIAAAGFDPVPAEPAYQPPEPVADAASAIELLIVAEEDAVASWRGLLERSDDADVRAFAAAAMTTSAVQATRWRAESGATPVAVSLPGW